MYRLVPLLAGFLFLGSIEVYAQSPSPDTKQRVRTLINLLDYIGKDYSNAVQEGEVINDFEYREMRNFSQQVADLHGQLEGTIDRPAFSDLSEPIGKLQGVIDDTSAGNEVNRLTGRLRSGIVALGLVRVTPQSWPDLESGQRIFEQRCQSCHGARGDGDGPLADQLDPPPTNFLDTANTDGMSPVQAYHTVKLGLEGTSMRAFSELSEQEVWDVAFYLNALSYSDSMPDSLRSRIRAAVEDTASLRTVSLMSNEEWKNLFRSKNIDPDQGLAVVRGLTSDPASVSTENTLAQALTLLDQAGSAYSQGNEDRALNFALDAYLEGVEPVESRIRASDAGMVRKLESEMLSVRSAIQNGEDPSSLDEQIQSASRTVEEARQLLTRQDQTFWMNFILAGSILLREGLEAFLIIMVILNVLRSVDAEYPARYVHGGWIAAIFAGIGGWFLLQSLIDFSSLQRELMEAIGAGIAVVLLLYIGFWLHSKSHVQQWKRFISERVNNLLSSRNLWGLAFLSFVVVFREAFESILFLSSIQLESPGGGAGIFAALVTVTLIIAGIGFVFTKVSRNIPIRQVFRYSSLMLAVLAVILVGKGIRSLQEAGYMNIESLAANWSIPTLGIYATWPTLLAQISVLAIIFGLWHYSNRLAKQQYKKAVS